MVYLITHYIMCSGDLWVNMVCVMSQQRQNSRKDNFDSSNARVSGRDFIYSFQVPFLDTVEETINGQSNKNNHKNNC